VGVSVSLTIAPRKEKVMAEAKKEPAKKKTATKKVIVAGEIAKTAKAPAEAKETKLTKKKETQNGTSQKTDKTEIQADIIETEVAEKATAKAGKRSAKAIAEIEEKQAKEERKAKSSEVKEEAAPKRTQKPPRSKLERKGKKYRKLAEQIDSAKFYSVSEAVDLATKTSPVKFDASVELHVNLGVDPKQADQNIRDIVVLPAGSGKTVRIAVFADPEGVAAAKKAGADIAGSDEFLQQLDKGLLNFDVLIATPSVMPKLGKYAKVLGPKGLMPNPKSGTVTADVTKAVSEAKAGRVEYRIDSTGIVHLSVGKVSFGKDKLLSNVQAVLKSIKSNKPASIKSVYVKAVYVTTAMGPSIKVDLADVNA